MGLKMDGLRALDNTFFAASEGFGVEGFLAFAVGLWDLAGEFALVGEDEFLA